MVKKPRLRILQCVSSMNIGGIESFLMAVNRKLDHEAIVFDFLYYIDEPCFFDDEIERLGGRIYRLGLDRKRPLKSRRKTMEFFRSHEEYRIVHVHMGSMVSLVPILVGAKKFDVPVRIIHAHSSETVTNGSLLGIINSKIHKTNIKLHGNDVTFRMACSLDAARWFGFPEKGWEFIPNGIDTEKFKFNALKRKDARKELGLGEDIFVLGNVGRLSPQKNQAFLLEVFAKILVRNPSAKLLLVGDGELDGALREKAHALHVFDNVIHLENRVDTDRLYAAMDVFCLPSLFEGLGISLLEAEASGLPCVVSDNVPAEGQIVNCFRIPLDCATDIWAEKILESSASCPSRADAARLVRDAGFDVSDVAMHLQEKYINMVANINK